MAATARRPLAHPIAASRALPEAQPASAERAAAAAAWRLATCRAKHDAAAEDADLLDRYRQQGRISDAGLRRALQLDAEAAARRAAFAACVGPAASFAGAALPRLEAATAELWAQMHTAAPAYALEAALPRRGLADTLRRRWTASAATCQVLRDDLGLGDGIDPRFDSAAGLCRVVDVAIVPPAPVPLVDADGRHVGAETPAAVVLGPAPVPLAGLCLQRFVVEERRLGRAAKLWALPQWRVATCLGPAAGDR